MKTSRFLFPRNTKRKNGINVSMQVNTYPNFSWFFNDGGSKVIITGGCQTLRVVTHLRCGSRVRIEIQTLNVTLCVRKNKYVNIHGFCLHQVIRQVGFICGCSEFWFIRTSYSSGIKLFRYVFIALLYWVPFVFLLQKGIKTDSNIRFTTDCRAEASSVLMFSEKRWNFSKYYQWKLYSIWWYFHIW